MERALQILLADDEEIAHQTIADYLRDSGHVVDRVYDGLSALRAVEDNDYDLALIDMRMPSMDGFSLLVNLQETRPDMPVVFITGYGDMEMALRAIRLGAMDFLPKPVKLLELDAALEKSIRFRNRITQNKQDREATQIDSSRLRKWNPVKHPVFFTLLLIGCLTAILIPIFVPLVVENRAETARRTYAESALQESERRYHQLSENVTDVVWLMDTNFRTTYVNSAVTNLLGYAVEEVMEKTWEQLMSPKCYKVIKKIFEEELARQYTDGEDMQRLQPAKIQIMCKNGSGTWVEVKCAALQSSGGQPTGLLVMLRKIIKGTEMANAKDCQYVGQRCLFKEVT